MLALVSCTAATTEPGVGAEAFTAGDSQEARTTRGAGPLFPAALGYEWTYATTYTGSAPQTQTTRVTGRQTVDGRDAWVIETTWSTSLVRRFAAIDGDDVVMSDTGQGDWFPHLKTPIAEGASWTYWYAGDRRQTWTEVGAQTVAAGTFEDCWRVDHFVSSMAPSDVNYFIMCRGVGHVLQVIKLANGYELHQELMSKSF